MKTLYLLRHAKAEPGGKKVSDMARPLAARGIEACIMIGNYMKARHYMPALVLSSPSSRTENTYLKVKEAADIPAVYQAKEKLYLATSEDILNCVQNASDTASSLMIIGHNPGMHHIALALSKPDESAKRMLLELKYPTGALAVLQFYCDHWHDIALGQGELTDFVTPEQL